jgi:hypothetical protein
MKAAFKLHVELDHEGLIPAFASLTQGKVSDMTQARLFQFPKGSVVVFDKGYNCYKWHNTFTQAAGGSRHAQLRDHRPAGRSVCSCYSFFLAMQRYPDTDCHTRTLF